MAIRISRNDSGNCINFIGSTSPAYWNACLSAQINSDNAGRVDIINDIRSANDPETRYEFYAVDYTDFADRDGNSFANAQSMVDYVNENANVVGVSDVGADLTNVNVNFRLDATSTSVIMDNGSSFGVNTIQAVADTDGTIHIHAIGAGAPSTNPNAHEHKYFEKLAHTAVNINGNPVAGGLNDVVNALNELFTVGAFQEIVIADPYSTMVADVAGVVATGALAGEAIDPATADVGAGTATHNNKYGWLSSDTIDQAGEYFTFDIRVEGTIGMGLVCADAADVIGSATYGDPATFCDGAVNSSHYGYQFAHYFHPSPNGPWTNYGANTGYVMGPGWSNVTHRFMSSPEGADWLAGNPVKMRVGIDTNGFISIDYYDASESTWIVCARTNYPTAQGVEYKLGIKFADSNVRLFSAPKIHELEPAAPTMYFRYIESPDGYYSYPLFATQEEADYYELTESGVDNGSHTHVYPDDPTNSTWYMPSTRHQMNYGLTPVEDGITTFESNAITWTEITSLTNADLVPVAFADTTLTVDEGASVNFQTQPAGSDYTTTMSGLTGTGLTAAVDGSLHGTAAEVAGDNVTTPSVSHTITVTRTNSYGSSTGTLTLVITNLTAPEVHAITGFHHESTSTALVDSDTLADGSVVRLQNITDDGNRLAIDKAWFDSYVLPAITAGTGAKSVWMGWGKETGGSPDWSNGVGAADFELAFEFYSDDSVRANNSWKLRVYKQGVNQSDVGIGGQTSGLYNYIFVNDDGTIRIAGLLPSYGNATSYVWDAPSLSWEDEVTGLTAQNREFYIGTTGTQLDIAATNMSEVVEPSAPSTLTSWTKALAFSGSNEHLKQVSSSMYRQPLQMNGLANTVDLGTRSQGETSNNSSSRPWATAVVFKSDGYSGNQIIWNQGEGSSSGNDNIYLRLTAVGSLMFGWGREGTGYNECKIANQSISSSNWYAVYVAHSGVRLGGNDASAANLADCFDIRLMSSADSFGSLGANLSTASNWTSTGQRMDRTFAGDFTIGGRGSGYSFRGKVASMITTTLIGVGNLTHSTPNSQQPGGLMYTDAQIEVMLTDPVKWVADYKVRHGAYNVSAPFRPPASQYTIQPFLVGSATSAPDATQVWLMGNGTSDSYSNGIRNYINTADQNNTKLQLNSMVSNDIETVSIAGLS
jgi:hypothetical protein